MQEQPQCREVGEEPFGEDLLKVGLDPGRPREARVVAHEPQGGAVRGNPPQRPVLGVQVLLEELRSRPPPGSVPKLCERLNRSPLSGFRLRLVAR